MGGRKSERTVRILEVNNIIVEVPSNRRGSCERTRMRVNDHAGGRPCGGRRRGGNDKGVDENAGGRECGWTRMRVDENAVGRENTENPRGLWRRTLQEDVSRHNQQASKNIPNA